MAHTLCRRAVFYMKSQSVKAQAALLTCVNALVRGLGFGLHVALSRILGAEALGVMELSHSAHMLSVAPVTAGLPAAVSRLTAVRGDAAALRAGRSLALRMSAALIPLWLLLSPWTARLLGDIRTLPPLLAFAPSVAVQGLTAVYSGYCYGLGDAWPPALATLTEQALRFLLSAGLLLLLPQLTLAGRAAIPAAAEALAGAAALGLMALLLSRKGKPAPAPHAPGLRGDILRLSLPLTGTRLMQTLSRPLTAALLPRLLISSGMAAGEATAAVGMLHGMVLPALFLPGIFTSALGMVGTPAIARRQGTGVRRAALQVLAASLACGLMGWAAIRLAAGFLASAVYRLPALSGLFRAAAPMALLFSLQQAAGTLLNGLGQQKKTLLPAAVGTALSILLMCRWASSPLGLYGAIYAMTVGRAVTLLWQLAAVLPALEITAG